jgi:hypothetical protein
MRTKNVEAFLHWTSRGATLLWTCFAAAGFYFKDRAIREMHDPSCCADAVQFSALSSQPGHVSAATAIGYQVTQWGFAGSLLVLVVLHIVSRRFTRVGKKPWE